MPNCSCASASPCAARTCGGPADVGAGGGAACWSRASQAVAPTRAPTAASSNRGLNGLNTQKRWRHWRQRSGLYINRWRTLSWACSVPPRTLPLPHCGQTSGMDLVQSYHCDCTGVGPNNLEGVHEQKFGIWCWRNMLKQTGQFRFEKITGNGLATEGQMQLTADRTKLTVLQHSISLPYVFMADWENTGRLG